MDCRLEQKKFYDVSSHEAPIMKIGDDVRVLNKHREWTGATIVGLSDTPRSLIVKTNTGATYRRNTSQVRPTEAKFVSEPSIVMNVPGEITNLQNNHQSNISSKSSEKSADVSTQQSTNNSQQSTNLHLSPSISTSSSLTNVTKTETTTRSGRIIKPVKKLDL